RILRSLLALSLTTLFIQSNGTHADEPRVPVLENLPQHLRPRLRPLQLPEGVRDQSEYQIIDKLKLWPAGSRLKVSFMQGINQDVCRYIASIANEWTKYGNISFDFGRAKPDDECRVYEEDDKSDIRISFRYSGYWSLVGTDCRRKAMAGEPTMN